MEESPSSHCPSSHWSPSELGVLDGLVVLGVVVGAGALGSAVGAPPGASPEEDGLVATGVIGGLVLRTIGLRGACGLPGVGVAAGAAATVSSAGATTARKDGFEAGTRSVPAREITVHTMAEPKATTSNQAEMMPMGLRKRLTNLIVALVAPDSAFSGAYVYLMPSVLVIEDDDAIRAAIRRGLTERGHAVAVAATGFAGLEHALKDTPHVVLLDLGLPDVDGLTVISMIRATSDVPIIVITAQDDDPTMIRALDSGADDYVVKPFGTDQVAARIRAVLRRGGQSASGSDPIRVGDLAIDEGTRSATLSGVPLDLARKEFDLLLALAHRRGDVVTKRELLADVWQQAYGGSDRTVDVHLSWLRRKLGETAAEPRYLLSVRGVGVRLVDPQSHATQEQSLSAEPPVARQTPGGVPEHK
jgi:two-component system, OmpR family, KDP operon response regulator KdpE